jgi:VIT1/CCC1 family predicted Fe2+/Mn2+ transporter
VTAHAADGEKRNQLSPEADHFYSAKLIIFRALQSALTPTSRSALVLSIIVTAAALTAFGYVKGHFTGAPPLRSALYTALIGGFAAAAAFLVARAIV